MLAVFAETASGTAAPVRTAQILRGGPTADENELVFVERTGHNNQKKEQEVADVLLETVSQWRKGNANAVLPLG